MDDLEVFVQIDKRIDEAENQAAENHRESLRDRWEFGRLMLDKRVGKQLPKGVMGELVATIGKSETELAFRMRFAERYPTEDEVRTAIRTFGSWTQVKRSLPKLPGKKDNPPSPPPRNKNAAAIADLTEQGKTQDEIAKEIGQARITVRREQALNAEREAGRQEADRVDWSTAPGSQQEKLEKATARIRRELERELRAQMVAQLDQYQAKLNEDFAKRKAQLDEQRSILNGMRDEERRRYQLGIEAQKAKGLWTPGEYKTVLAVVHPDNSAGPEKRAEAFRLVKDEKVKTLLVKEI